MPLAGYGPSPLSLNLQATREIESSLLIFAQAKGEETEWHKQ
jgi:hypothetical protein